MAFLRPFTEGPGGTRTWPGLPKASGQNGERGRLGATGPGFKSSSNTSCWLPLGKSLCLPEPQCPLLENGDHRSAHCEIIDPVGTVPGRYETLD